jgi:hypothetical protein
MFKIDTGSFFVRFYRSIINILALLRIRCLLTPGSGKGFFGPENNLFWVLDPDLGVKKAPDPDPQH